MIDTSKLIPFDAANYLKGPDSKQMVFGYLNVALEENDAEFLVDALDDIARSSEMAKIKVLDPANPSFAEISAIVESFGLKLIAVPKNTDFLKYLEEN